MARVPRVKRASHPMMMLETLLCRGFAILTLQAAG
jgi:hypothetical protein